LQGLQFARCTRVPNYPDPSIGRTGAPGINLGPEHIDPRIFSIAEGTTEVLRNFIGERVLGLPKDP
jgi:hypothetical protein